MTRALYISHNGMLENLGQSQVLPYVRGLTRRGFDFDLLSFELPDVTDEKLEELSASLRHDGIRWLPLRRARRHDLATKARESAQGVMHALKAALTRRPRVVHGRSYLPSLMADMIRTVVPGAKLLFDCRGMLGDEYVDAGYWTEQQFEYRLLKAYEKRLFRQADGVVVLTERLRTILRGRDALGVGVHTAAIPCCVDSGRFYFDAEARARVRRELGFTDDRLVLVYSGSLGGWYQEAEMARLAGLLQKSTGRVAVLVCTPQPGAELRAALAGEGLDAGNVVFRRVNPSEMRAYLSAGDLAVSFIKSCFSKLGSSPTKVAEYLACGLPVVLNGDIGDQQELAAERDACVVLPALDAAALQDAVEPALALASLPLEARVANASRVARDRFDMEEVGVSRYEALYRSMLR